jgi:hypothetical protein
MLHIGALADSEGSTGPYTLESADKKYIFVMLRGCNHNDSVHLYPPDRYPESGLYLNDGSVAPLWTVDWCGNVLLPSDGVHVVRTGHWARTYEGYNQEAITFFAGGKRLKSYQVNDLVTLPYLLPHSSSHFEWRRLITPEDGAQSFTIMERRYPYEAGVVFDQNAHTMTLETLQGDCYAFDLKTGEIVSARRPVRTIAISLLALSSLLYVWYLIRATARARLGLWKHYHRLALNALVLAWLFTLVGVGLTSVAMETGADFRSALVFGGIWRAVVYPPIDLAEQNEWTWANPYGTFHPYYRAQGALYLITFWFAVFAAVGMVNSILVWCLRLVRRRWSAGARPQALGRRLSGEEESHIASEDTKRRSFKEVQHYSQFWLGLLACFLSLFAALSLSYALDSPEIISDPATILLVVLLGVLLPILLLNVKMVTTVRNKQVVIGLRLLWLQKRKIAFDEIRQCSIQPRDSLEPDLIVQKYAVWANTGVLIELMERDWVFIGSKRPQELLGAITPGSAS